MVDRESLQHLHSMFKLNFRHWNETHCRTVENNRMIPKNESATRCAPENCTTKSSENAFNFTCEKYFSTFCGENMKQTYTNTVCLCLCMFQSCSVSLAFFWFIFGCLRTFNLVFGNAFPDEIHQNRKTNSQNYCNQHHPQNAHRHIQRLCYGNAHRDRYRFIYGKSFVDWKQWPHKRKINEKIPSKMAKISTTTTTTTATSTTTILKLVAHEANERFLSWNHLRK